MMDEHMLAELRRKDAQNLNLAAYSWQVRRCPTVLVQGEEPDTEILLAEYDVQGKIHQLDEIVMPPPYLFCLISSRANIPNRFVRIDPGWTHVYCHRVQGALGIAGNGFPQVDCVIYGTRSLIDMQMNILIVYPSGLVYGPFFSLKEAYAHEI
jgi:hypothetical protein